MTYDEKIEFLWNKFLEDAIGTGHPAPFDYADAKVRAAGIKQSLWERREANARREA